MVGLSFSLAAPLLTLTPGIQLFQMTCISHYTHLTCTCKCSWMSQGNVCFINKAWNIPVCAVMFTRRDQPWAQQNLHCIIHPWLALDSYNLQTLATEADHMNVQVLCFERSETGFCPGAKQKYFIQNQYGSVASSFRVGRGAICQAEKRKDFQVLRKMEDGLQDLEWHLRLGYKKGTNR